MNNRIGNAPCLGGTEERGLTASILSHEVGVIGFHAVRKLLLDQSYQGWCTVERDCDPAGPTSPVDDARSNRPYLCSIGFN